MDRESSTHSERWDVLGSKLPKSEIVYFCQMIAVYIIIVRSIVNLSLQNGKNEMWITLLSSVIGYALSSAETICDLVRRVFDIHLLDGLQ
jgi:hypothetical protein